MFSSTFIESKSAPPWKSIARRRRRGASSSSDSGPTDWPKTQTSPSSGLVRPLMCRRVTLFPVPEGPRMQRTSPRRICRLTPARISRDPYLFHTSRNSTMGSPRGAGAGVESSMRDALALMLGSQGEEELRQEEVGDQDRDRGQDDRPGGGLSHGRG